MQNSGDAADAADAGFQQVQVFFIFFADNGLSVLFVLGRSLMERGMMG